MQIRESADKHVNYFQYLYFLIMFESYRKLIPVLQTLLIKTVKVVLKKGLS